MLSFITGTNGGLKTNEIEQAARRDKFSDYLPYHRYDDESEEFINTDGTYGYAWECTPLIFGGENSANSLSGLLRKEYPMGSVLQFILFADDDIEHIINAHLETKKVDNPVVLNMAKYYTDYLRESTKGNPNLSGVPIRNFRAFFTVKSPEKLNKDIIVTTHEALDGGKISPTRMNIYALLHFLRKILNDDCENATAYDEYKPIRKQLIKANTIIEEDPNSHMQIGSRYFKCITPKNLAKNIDILTINKLFGGFKGKQNDAEQITTPFIYTLNILIEDSKSAIMTKSALHTNQKSAGGLSVLLKKKVDEYLWAEDTLERERFMRIIPIMWVYSDDKDKAERSSSRARRLWEGEGFIMQEDRHILKILFTMALPFGVYNTKNNIEIIDRDFYLPTEALSRFLPIQADFKGMGAPVVPMISRKGQLMGFDIFNDKANNHNMTIFAESGSGKSFFLNHIINNYYAAGNMIRMIDIGYSYYKNCMMLKGNYIDLARDKPCINPFAEMLDLEKDLTATAMIVAKMVYSTTNQDPTEPQFALIKDAVRFAYERDEGVMGIDHVYEYLSTFPQHCSLGALGNMEPLIREAKTMAFTLREFTSKGTYGALFNGKATLDFSSDPFVVLELDGLLQIKDLFNVATMQVVNAATKDLYKRGGSQARKMLIFEEAYQFLKDNDSGTLKELIEAGYRRARKYGGCFGIVSQSILDISSFGSVGPVLSSNSAFKFYLQSGDIYRAKRDGIIDYTDFEVDLMATTQSDRPRYSEVFMVTPAGKGVGRLVVDPYSYYVYTSSKGDNDLIESYVKQGMDYHTAIMTILESKRKAA